jgi:hypothetical protein
VMWRRRTNPPGSEGSNGTNRRGYVTSMLLFYFYVSKIKPEPIVVFVLKLAVAVTKF